MKTFGKKFIVQKCKWVEEHEKCQGIAYKIDLSELYSKYRIEEEDVEKYGLEHLVSGGYKKRST